MPGLAPPTQTPVDPGAHDLTDASTSDDHFSDASEGRHSSSAISTPSSPIPVTRVERVDDLPSHGEVPGTPAYKLRTQDAVPDEIEIVPDGQRSRSASRLSEADRPVMSPNSPGRMPIPKTVVEKVEPTKASHGEIPGTPAFEMRMADAKPDEVLLSPIEAASPLKGEPITQPRSRSTSRGDRRSSTSKQIEPSLDGDDGQLDQVEDDAVDDFDDFEDGFGSVVDGEVDQHGEQDDDFDDFGVLAHNDTVPSFADDAPLPDPLAHLPALDLRDTENQASLLSYFATIFPDTDIDLSTLQATRLDRPPTTKAKVKADPLLSDRSASLWAQLVAPPPMSPPDWTRSRIRRLFLVSLGVPVDLDEILPASKQKKLVLPSTMDGKMPGGADQSGRVAQLRKQDRRDSSGSTDGSRGRSSERQGPLPPPEFDSHAAKQLCSTTKTALDGLGDDELRLHVKSLESCLSVAEQALEYWTKRKQSAVGDKEAFEGVIENLVGFMRKNKTKSKR